MMVQEFPKNNKSNLDSFLDSVTPVVPSQFLTKEEIENLHNSWNQLNKEKIEYFQLIDFWNCFEKCSSYGVAVPITLSNGEILMQHFVPYVSAIQLFISKSSAKNLRGEKNGAGSSSSNGSSSDDTNGNTEKPWEEGFSEEGIIQDDKDQNPISENLGFPYFQFMDSSIPYIRYPLLQKIERLAKIYPGVLSLNSLDLSPASWVSVAWYPIYAIPMGEYIKDLSTCFLTYHSLSSSFRGADLNFVSMGGVKGKEKVEGFKSNPNSKRKEGEGFHVPPFGVAYQKMHGNLWLSGIQDEEQYKLEKLWSRADSWLKQLNFRHHDFNFFFRNRRIL